MDILRTDKNNNVIAGYTPFVNNSTISFRGQNNLLYCEEKCVIEKSIITFHGSNSLIYLGKSNHRIQADIYNNSVLHSGSNNTYTDGNGFNRVLRFLLSEERHCFIGNNCLFSYDIVIRNSDPHLLYSCESGERINPTQSVYIGDHVWVGQSVFLFKGSSVDSGSVIGARSVVSGKKIPHNTVWAGIPARQIKTGVFWSGSCVHGFDSEATEASMNYSDYIKYRKAKLPADSFIYKYDEASLIKWHDIEERLNTGTAKDKCLYLIDLNKKKTKNRFVNDHS